jgi:SAM-dependent methyltransferase
MIGEKDKLSTLFEKNISKEERSKLGQHFTHKELVRLIMDKITLNKDNLILDPTCGAGAFLIECLNDNNVNNIYGVDIDSKALELCRLNLEKKHKINDENLIRADFINDSVFQDKKFDIIIGNPPFKNLKSNEYNTKEKIYNEAIKGIANSATLVLRKSFELLKDGGFLGFVLPKNFLRVNSFEKIRTFLLKNSKILYLIDVDHHFKDVRCDQILIIVQKISSQEELNHHVVKIIPYEKGETLKDQKGYMIPQRDFLSYDFFPLFYSQDVKNISDKLLGISETLSSYGEIFRGISLSSSHPAVNLENKNFYIKGYRGDSIKRFGVKYYLFIDEKILPKNEKNKIKRLKRDKIVLQNLFSKEGGIYACISKNDEISLDTVTNIILKENIDPFFILGILGSKLSNFFMISVIYLNSNFTMHADKSYIGKIPIIYKKDKRISEITKELIKISDKFSNEFKNKYDELNHEVFKLYNLNSKEINVINKTLIKFMSKKHNG